MKTFRSYWTCIVRLGNGQSIRTTLQIEHSSLQREVRERLESKMRDAYGTGAELADFERDDQA